MGSHVPSAPSGSEEEEERGESPAHGPRGETHGLEGQKVEAMGAWAVRGWRKRSEGGLHGGEGVGSCVGCGP